MSNLPSIKSITGRWLKDGTACPLFLRLTDANPQIQEESPPLRVLSKEDTKASIIEELQNLLNTSIPIPIEKYQLIMQTPEAQGYPELYGLPDFSNVDPTNQSSWPFYEELIQQTITYYEPRLKDVKVKIISFARNTQTLTASISGSLILGSVIEPFTFSLSFGRK